MNKLSLWLPSPHRVAACGALLALGCTAELTGQNVPPAASAGSSTSGVGGMPAGGGGAPMPSNPTGLESNPPPFQPAPGMLRRLTRSQFANAVKDVFGVDVNVNELDPDIGHFPTIGAASVHTSPRGVEQYQTAIESAVNAVFDDATKRAAFLGCTPGNTSPDTCTRSLIEKVGRRAWRRPLEAAEVDQLMAVAATATTELGSGVEGARWASVAIFTSPSFIYRPELGAPGADGARRFTGYEIAGRLSFLIWNSLPDQQLMDDAASGALNTAEGIRAAVNRLLDAPNGAGRRSIGEFSQEYLELDRVLTQPKDATLYPGYNAALQAGMVHDMRGTWESVAFDEQASALSLFSTLKANVNADLAKLYGVDATGLTATTFKLVTLPANSPRAGILSKAAFLSQHANQHEGSPTLRGKFIRDVLMCKTVPPPPAGVALVVPVSSPDKPTTKRERLDAHRAEPACAGCHALMDPLGLPLESFDAIGAYRTTEHGLTIDTSGEVDGLAVANSRAMGEAMSQSAAIANCMVRRFYSYAAGHEQREVDGSVINALAASFETSGFKLRELLLATVTHDAFSVVAPQP